MLVDSAPIELLTVSDVAKILKVSESTVRRLQSDRCLPFLKVGGCVRFAKADVRSYIVQQRVGTISK